jgi:hypothetical protein
MKSYWMCTAGGRRGVWHRGKERRVAQGTGEACGTGGRRGVWHRGKERRVAQGTGQACGTVGRRGVWHRGKEMHVAQGAGEVCGTDGGRLEHFCLEAKETDKVTDFSTDGQRLLFDVTYKFLRSFV